MIELIFVVCLSAQPSTCEEKALQFVDMPMMGCMTGGQAVLARWVNEHEGWEIQSWGCRHVRVGEDRNA